MTYVTLYEEIRSLGCGGFSTVFEAKFKTDNKLYAIKKIPFEERDKEKTLFEINLLSKLDTDFAVQYYDSWIEPNYYLQNDRNYSNMDTNSLHFNAAKTLLLHIRMEICPFTLEHVISRFGYETYNQITELQFCLACELFSQLLESIKYLYKQTPQIIHRDLKPENIMIRENEFNFCVVLSDFGLSTFHEFVNQSHSKYVGTRYYRAPEVNLPDYDTKADIYSLGVIVEMLFNINLNREKADIDKTIKPKYKKIRKILIACKSPIAKNRPNSEKILKKKNYGFIR